MALARESALGVKKKSTLMKKFLLIIAVLLSIAGASPSWAGDPYVKGWDSSWNSSDIKMDNSDGNLSSAFNVSLNSAKGHKLNHNTSNADRWSGYEDVKVGQNYVYKVQEEDNNDDKFKANNASQLFDVYFYHSFDNVGRIELYPTATKYYIVNGDKTTELTTQGNNTWSATVDLDAINGCRIKDNNELYFCKDHNSNYTLPETMTNQNLVRVEVGSNQGNNQKMPKAGSYTVTVKKVNNHLQLTYALSADYSMMRIHQTDGEGNNGVDLSYVPVNENGKWVFKDVNLDGSMWYFVTYGSTNYGYDQIDNNSDYFWRYDNKNDANKDNRFQKKSDKIQSNQLLSLTFDPDTQKFTPSVYNEIFTPTPGKRTIYFVFKQGTTDFGIAENNIHVYTYDNASTNPQIGDGMNADFPGKMIFECTDENITKIFNPNGGNSIRVFAYSVPSGKHTMCIFSDGSSTHQTRNLLIEDNGVYYFDDELLPANILLQKEDGSYTLRRYVNTADHKTATYMYVPVTEFGYENPTTKDEKEALEKVTLYADVTVVKGQVPGHENEDWVVSGLKGTTKMILVEYNGQYFWRLPSASIPDGCKVKLEFNLNGGDNNGTVWKSPCSSTTHNDETNHYNCDDPKRIMKIPAETGFEYHPGIVYHRYNKLPENIYALTQPKSLVLVNKKDGSETVPTEVINGTYYWNTSIMYAENSQNEFYFKATFESNTLYYRQAIVTGTLVPNILATVEVVGQPDDVTGNFFREPKNSKYPKGFRLRFSWTDQNFWFNPVEEDAIRQAENDHIDAVAVTSSEEVSEPLVYTMHADFNDPVKHYEKTNVSFVMNEEHKSKFEKTYGHKDHKPVCKPAMSLMDADQNLGKVDFMTSVAGNYKIRIENPASATFAYQVFEHDVYVHPTLESLGLTVQSRKPKKLDNGMYLLSYAAVELEGENAPISGGSKNIVWGPTKAYISPNNVKDDHVENIVEIWYKNLTVASDDAAAGADEVGPQFANGDARATDYFTGNPAESGYTKYDKDHSINIREAANNQQSYKMIVGQNGLYSKEVTVNFNSNNTETSVEEIEGVEEAPVYYTLQGVRVENPDKGIYIRVRGKKADKVMF